MTHQIAGKIVSLQTHQIFFAVEHIACRRRIRAQGRFFSDRSKDSRDTRPGLSLTQCFIWHTDGKVDGHWFLMRVTLGQNTTLGPFAPHICRILCCLGVKPAGQRSQPAWLFVGDSNPRFSDETGRRIHRRWGIRLSKVTGM